MVIENSSGEPLVVTVLPRQCGKTWIGKILASGFNKKEKAMKKTEAKEQLEKLQVEVDRLREIVEQEDKKPWRAGTQVMYYYVNDNGHISASAEFSHSCDNIKYAKGWMKGVIPELGVL